MLLYVKIYEFYVWFFIKWLDCMMIMGVSKKNSTVSLCICIGFIYCLDFFNKLSFIILFIIILLINLKLTSI